MGRMVRVSVALTGLVAGVMSVGGCTAATPDALGTPTPVSVAGGRPGFSAGGVGDSTSPFASPTFPLTLRRTGGIAGYDDTVVLKADGKVLVETRSIHGRVCTLAPGQRQEIISLLGTLRLGTSTATDGTSSNGSDGGSGGGTVPGDDGGNDAIVISIRDRSGYPLDLSDPSLGEVAGLVGSLVADVTLSSPATTRCTTPSAPVPAPAT